MNLATSFLFLNMAIKVLEIDKRQIEQSHLKIKTPYIKLIDKLITKAIKERRKLKSLMHQKKIHIAPLYREGEFSYYEIVINRSKTVKCYFNPVIKKEVENMISCLMGMKSM